MKKRQSIYRWSDVIDCRTICFVQHCSTMKRSIESMGKKRDLISFVLKRNEHCGSVPKIKKKKVSTDKYR